jgi:hypothetical protein
MNKCKRLMSAWSLASIAFALGILAGVLTAIPASAALPNCSVATLAALNVFAFGTALPAPHQTSERSSLSAV